MATPDYFEFVGSLVVDGEEQPLVVRLYRPEFNPEGGDYFCRISAPHLCMEGDRVFGVDELQAWEIGVRWINMRAEGRIIRDRNGSLLSTIPLPERPPA